MREGKAAIREASLADITKLQAVLKEAGLSTDELLVNGTRDFLAEDEERQPAGVVGLELRISAALGLHRMQYFHA